MKSTLEIISNERGSIFFESLIVAPVLIILFLFCADFLMFTKSHTFVSQVTRDAAIYFATIPGEPSSHPETNLHKDDDNMMKHEMLQLCSNESETIDPRCYHLATQERAYRSLQVGSGNLDIESVNMTTSYDGQNVTLEINADIRVSFWWNTSRVNTSATLRKVNL
jgi:hypothetical protein